MLSQAYGYRFASQFGDQPSEVWIGAMQGVTGAQMAEALRRCVEDYPEWPPGAIEFKALCAPTPESLKLLRESDAFSQAVHWKQVRDEHRKPEVFAALQAMDGHRFRAEKTENARKMFAKAYSAVVARVASGEILPEVPLQIPLKMPPKPTDKSRGKAALAELRAIF